MTEHHFETPGPVALRVENREGTVTIRATDTTRSRVRVEGPDADATQVELDGHRLVVVSRSLRGGSGDRHLEITIDVPTGSDLSAQLGSADLVAEGVLHATTVRSGSGDLILDQITGKGLVETGSGDIRISTAEQDLHIKSGSGGVTVDQSRSELIVSTGSGDVRADTVAGPTVVKTGSGDLIVTESLGDVKLSTGSGDLTVRCARAGRVSVKGASGDVHVGVRAGTPVWTDVSTVSGEVRSTLESAGRPDDGQAHVEIRVTTVSGDIVLAPA